MYLQLYGALFKGHTPKAISDLSHPGMAASVMGREWTRGRGTRMRLALRMKNCAVKLSAITVSSHISSQGLTRVWPGIICSLAGNTKGFHVNHQYSKCIRVKKMKLREFYRQRTADDALEAGATCQSQRRRPTSEAVPCTQWPMT